MSIWRDIASLGVVVALGVGGLVGVLALTYAISGSRDASDENSIHRMLAQVASRMNDDLPTMIDSQTRLDTTAAGARRSFYFRYTLLDVSDEGDFDTEQFVSQVRPFLVNQLRTHPQMKPFWQSGIVTHFQYSDEQGVFLCEIVIEPSRLSKPPRRDGRFL